MSWISVTPSIKRAVEIINGLEASKYRLLVNRIMQTMQSGAENEKAFSEEEESKLEISLGLGREDLKLLLDATTFITEQAAYHVTKPAVLQRQLAEVLQFNEDKAEAFVGVWTNCAKGIVEQLRQKSVFPNQNMYRSIKRAVEIINGLEASKYRLLVNRIMQTMQSGAENEKAFSEEEENKLEISLGLGREDLKLLLDATTFITEQAAYHVTKPAVLQRQLAEVLQFNEDKAEAFVGVWTNCAKGIVEQLRQKSVFPNQLEDIRWSLNLQTASHARSREAIPKAVFQFGLKTDGCRRENISLEFTHQELFNIYKQLEMIQNQLDKLH